MEDEFGEVRTLRFSADRMHLDFDARRSKAGEEPAREWIDYRVGVGQRRSFKNGRLESMHSSANLFKDIRFSEFFSENGEPLSVRASVRDVEVQMRRPDLEETPFTITQPNRSGGLLRRTYFSNGQLNAEQVAPIGQSFRYTKCFDEDGTELAPNGTGLLRLLEWISDDGQPQWWVGQLVEGLLHGVFRHISADGAEIGEPSVYDMGKPVSLPPTSPLAIPKTS